MRTWVAALVLGAATGASAASERVGGLEVDYAGFLSRNDVVYLGPARAGWEGLPLGNGTLGAQVWQPEGITLQLNTPLGGVYGGAIARVHLKTSPGMLTGVRGYEQTDLMDGVQLAGSVAMLDVARQDATVVSI